MSNFRRSVFVASALIMSPTAVAFAADLSIPDHIVPEPVVEVPAPAPIPESGCFYGGGGYKDGNVGHHGGRSCWYVRGDLSYSDHGEPDMFEDNDTDFTFENIDNAWSIGGGIGRYISKHTRFDLTLEYRFDTDVNGRDPQMQAQHELDMESLVGLANIYYDFGCRCQFTPYVGFGLGFAHHETSRRVITSDFPGVALMGGPGAEETDVAAAAMVGFSLAVANGFLIDAGYRFLYLGDAETGPTDDGLWAPLEIEGIHAHEIRVGFRKELF
ncbi:MAG: outer membrane protein [Methyloligellaceae bacterium]